MTRVSRWDLPGAAREARLSAGRGEYEAFQIVVHASRGGLTRLDAVASDLVGRSGSTIPAANVALFLERYVNVPMSSHAPPSGNRPGPSGVYPDPLVPLATPSGRNPTTTGMAVAAGENQPLWVEVLVPRGIPAGAYSGAIAITSDQGRASVPISLTVWDFDLPLTPSLRSSFGLTGARISDEAYQRLLVEHKVMPTYLAAGPARRLVPHGLNVAGLEFWSDPEGCDMEAPPTPDAVRAAMAGYPSGLDLYVYVVDEPLARCNDPGRIFGQIASWARNVHAAGAKTLVTVPPKKELFDDGAGRPAVDVWVMLPGQFDPVDRSYRAARARGDVFWSYLALAQDSYSPKWQIDFAPIDHRLVPGFMSQSLGLSGLLYWAVDHWSADPWRDVYFRHGPHAWAGEGLLVYPGERVGVRGGVPSMRLKWIREGVEDYEYVEMLKRLGRPTFALEVAQGVAADWRTWTRDPVALEQARARLGWELHRLAARRANVPGGSRRASGNAR
jgi:hypothetical protein